MTDFRNRFTQFSVLLLTASFLVLLPLNRLAAAGLFVAGAANLVVLRGWSNALRVAGDSAGRIKWSAYIWGLVRWAVYAAVFYIGYRFGGGRPAGIAGAAAGLVIPLVVMAYTAATEVETERTAD
ncbi:MAG: hypothetical protein NTZ09_16410 [Candidatus Hydrogenedentes bacterium]|nr:hypothetical protein [Candidatus Hydrogenedentota bacterium]